MSKLYFVATKHEQYRKQVFPPGSVVIDPWRYIPDQQDVRVRRIGENRPALISILMPSRGRPDGMMRAVRTALQTATYPRHLEIIVYLDEDDPQVFVYGAMLEAVPQLSYVFGARRLLSECWNLCYGVSKGEIIMHCGDDLTFDTPGWDVMVRDAFDAVPDKILFAYGNDLGPHGETFGTHGFVHRRWIDTVGYFLPPLFSSDWNDVWLNEVAKMIQRHKLLPFVTEHHHYTFGKAERDETHAEREERGARDGVVSLYKRTQKDREDDAAKLKAVMV